MEKKSADLSKWKTALALLALVVAVVCAVFATIKMASIDDPTKRPESHLKATASSKENVTPPLFTSCVNSWIEGDKWGVYLPFKVARPGPFRTQHSLVLFTADPAVIKESLSAGMSGVLEVVSKKKLSIACRDKEHSYELEYLVPSGTDGQLVPIHPSGTMVVKGDLFGSLWGAQEKLGRVDMRFNKDAKWRLPSQQFPVMPDSP